MARTRSEMRPGDPGDGDPAGSDPTGGDPAGSDPGGAGKGGAARGGGYPAARLRLLRRESQPGAAHRAELARLTDVWLAGAFGVQPPGLALVAVGGYGRGELSPGSDLDVLLLHDGRTPPERIAALAERIWYPVWDLGLALDHSVRTPDEARATAAEDLKVQLGLLDARHVAGDRELTAGLRTAVFAQWRAHAVARLPALRALAEERAERHGELRFLLEPDLKEARGGLRDATALRAVAASWLADAPREGLETARRTLLDARDALHLATGRSTDRLALQDQGQVAAALGLPDGDALLRQVYGAAQTLSYAGEVTWREVGRVLRARSGRSTGRSRLRGLLGAGDRTRDRAPGAAGAGPDPGGRTPLAEGVVAHDGEVALARTARPDRDPVLALRAAAAAAQAGLPLTPQTVRRLAAAAGSLPVPWPAAAREEFVTLLGAGPATVPVWEAFEAAGLITTLLPGWEHVRWCPQHNPVHRWTVDRHLVETTVRAAALTRRVHRPDLLLVAALLHDIGKGRPGDHSVVGEPPARELAARMGFGTADVAVLGTLVRHHLLLVDTATRRDLDDPATVQSVAGILADPRTLELLHALTEADALATGPAAWSSWRERLVAELVRRVDAVLAGEPAVAPSGAREPSAEAERLAVEAWRTSAPVLALRTSPEHATGAGEAKQAPAERGEAQRGPAQDGEARRGAVEDGAVEPMGVELLVALPDRPGVLAAVAGVLALHRLTVRSADLRILELPAEVTAPAAADASVLLLDWRVAAEFGPIPRAARLRADLVRVLEGSLDIAARLAEREAAYRGQRSRGGTAPPPPRVSVVPGGSRGATVIEVRAQDVPGLLYRVGLALERAKLRVSNARVSTLGSNAVDAFYVTGVGGVPLSPAEAAEVARQLEDSLG